MPGVATDPRGLGVRTWRKHSPPRSRGSGTPRRGVWGALPPDYERSLEDPQGREVRHASARRLDGSDQRSFERSQVWLLPLPEPE